MFKLHAGIRNFLKRDDSKINHFFYCEKRISKNKFFECEIVTYDPEYIFKVSIDLEFGGSDHAGSCLEIEILGLSISIKVYDYRHWDFENNRWMIYEEKE